MEAHERYSAVKGFFKQYELMYVMADERDVVRLRTNFRKGEQVRVYRSDASPEAARAIFLSYLKQLNSLKEQPQWYNAATSNCTTNIRGHTQPFAKKRTFDWRILLNGRIDEMVYENGGLDRSLPFETLRQISLINDKALSAGDGPGFSTKIREGLPRMTSDLSLVEHPGE